MQLRSWLVVVALWGCGSGSKPRPGVDIPIGHNLRLDGRLGVPVPSSLAAGVMQVPVTIDGIQGPSLLVDTGAPLTYVNPAAFPGASVPMGAGTVGTLAVGAATVHDVPTVGSAVLGPSLAGLLGANVICQFAATFDYRGNQFALGVAPAPSGVGVPGVDVPFQLLGGGDGTLPGSSVAVQFPATRIVVAAQIEGVERTLVVDTGSSFMVLTPELFTALVSDGRSTLSLPVLVPGGSTLQRVTRLHSVTTGGVEVDGIAAITLSDDTLGGIGLEVGRTVDGLVGVSFLREFLVTLDYPRRVVRLQRYADRSHISDEFQRVGFELGGTTRAYTVAEVFPGTDAQTQGVTSGAQVVSIDGQAIAGMDVTAADRLLRGTPGTTHTVRFTDPALADRSLTLRVEDLLPLR